ncbi:unnamed protein product [Vitrella brassicaformis CCMP3155]|uniref:Uncharacterized protein n=1 Tax=Vitrella brassicaformis (strain CCMP3155) TaxID=1169540 RepID=A0A0G4EUS5_VITBC|nr:unnamed protein product [Vitrella brassicaformis CCMP3155]|eukprot:CEM02350.1 unnamed protein product [Vitrella brassicaformis CCMP3155]
MEDAHWESMATVMPYLDRGESKTSLTTDVDEDDDDGAEQDYQCRQGKRPKVRRVKAKQHDFLTKKTFSGGQPQTATDERAREPTQSRRAPPGSPKGAGASKDKAAAPSSSSAPSRSDAAPPSTKATDGSRDAGVTSKKSTSTAPSSQQSSSSSSGTKPKSPSNKSGDPVQRASSKGSLSTQLSRSGSNLGSEPGGGPAVDLKKRSGLDGKSASSASLKTQQQSLPIESRSGASASRSPDGMMSIGSSISKAAKPAPSTRQAPRRSRTQPPSNPSAASATSARRASSRGPGASRGRSSARVGGRHVRVRPGGVVPRGRLRVVVVQKGVHVLWESALRGPGRRMMGEGLTNAGLSAVYNLVVQGSRELLCLHDPVLANFNQLPFSQTPTPRARLKGIARALCHSTVRDGGWGAAIAGVHWAVERGASLPDFSLATMRRVMGHLKKLKGYVPFEAAVETVEGVPAMVRWISRVGLATFWHALNILFGGLQLAKALKKWREGGESATREGLKEVLDAFVSTAAGSFFIMLGAPGAGIGVCWGLAEGILGVQSAFTTHIAASLAPLSSASPAAPVVKPPTRALLMSTIDQHSMSTVAGSSPRSSSRSIDDSPASRFRERTVRERGEEWQRVDLMLSRGASSDDLPAAWPDGPLSVGLPPRSHHSLPHLLPSHHSDHSMAPDPCMCRHWSTRAFARLQRGLGGEGALHDMSQSYGFTGGEGLRQTVQRAVLRRCERCERESAMDRIAVPLPPLLMRRSSSAPTESEREEEAAERGYVVSMHVMAM